MSSIDRLFRCITTLLCDKTHATLQDGIENSLILRQSDILLLTYQHFILSEGILFIYIHLRLSATGVHSS